MLAVWIHFLRKVLFLENLFFSSPYFSFWLSVTIPSVCGIFFFIVCTRWPEMWYWTLTKRGKIWQNIAFSRHMSFHAEASALAALQRQDKGFPHPAPKGTMLAASPRLVCLRHWKSKWREKNQLEFEEAALEVCDLYWRAQWRWQRVPPTSLPCVTGILWALLPAKASQSWKKRNPASVTSWEMLSGWCSSLHPNRSLPTGESPPSHSLGKALGVLQWHFPGEWGNHLLRLGWNWAGAGGQSLPHPGKNAAPTSTPWPESSLSPRKAEGVGVAASPKFR